MNVFPHPALWLRPRPKGRELKARASNLVLTSPLSLWVRVGELLLAIFNLRQKHRDYSQQWQK
jgi:hypothetical protein